MPYDSNFTLAPDAMNIAECQYYTAGTVKTTKLDSCIVVIGQMPNSNDLTALHLVMTQEDQNHGLIPFDLDAAQQITGNTINDAPKIGFANCTQTWIAGDCEFWEESESPSVQAGYNWMTAHLPNFQGSTQRQGECQATLNGNQIVYTWT